MNIQVLFFGQLTDITGTHTLQLEGISSTAGLEEALLRQFPSLGNKKYVIAVDKKIAASDTLLSEHSIVALMPPFSGG